MTTGRINQVTTLNPAASPKELRQGAPGGADLCTKVGATAKPKPDRPGRPTRRGAAPSGHPIAPTEFPKGRSAAGHSGPKTAVPGRMRPSGGGLPSSVNTVRRILAAASPQRRCGAVAINQPSTDTEICPLTRRIAGLLSPTASRLVLSALASRGVLFDHGNELNRVDISCRNVRYEGSCYGTNLEITRRDVVRQQLASFHRPEGIYKQANRRRYCLGSLRRPPGGRPHPGRGGEALYSARPPSLYILEHHLGTMVAILSTSIGECFSGVDLV